MSIKELRDKIQSLDKKIATFEQNYCAEEYLNFVEQGGCIPCDGTGTLLFATKSTSIDNGTEGLWIKCIHCNGQTIAHPLSFIEAHFLNDGTYISSSYKKTYHVHTNIFGYYPARTTLLSSSANSSKNSLISERARLYNELLLSKDEALSEFNVGDKVSYNNSEYTVLGLNYTTGELILKSITKNLNSGPITVLGDNVKRLVSLDQKLPDIIAKSQRQADFAKACRLAAISKGAVSAEVCIKETSARYWIDNFKQICPKYK